MTAATTAAAIVVAARVNWTYILILLVPSVAVLAIMALTWRSRVRQMREQDERRARNEAARRSGQGGRRSGGGAKRRRK